MISEVRNDVSDWPLPQVTNVDEWVPFEGQLFEDNEYVNSLTFQELQHEPLPQVNNIDEGVPFEGQVFESDNVAYEFYCLFAKQNGFSIRRDHIYKSSKNVSEENPSGVYKREFICHGGGIVKPRKTVEVENQRKRKSSRCDYGAKMVVNKRTIGFEKKWVVKYFNNSHNHELLDNKEVRFLPAYRNIPIVDQDHILLLSKVGCSVSIIMRVLELEKRTGTGNLPFLEKDIRNFIQSYSGIGKESDAADVLRLCKSLKDREEAFQVEFTIDESNKLEHIVWAFGDSIRAYEAFGDVVVFDTTYRINRYGMPLGIWSFLAFVKGKYPKIILTDQDLSIKEAIATELPNTKHAFCIWHIVAKLSSWFSFPLGSRYDDFKHEFHKVGVAVKIRNQAGEEARMRQKYHNPHITTHFPIEEHASSILTPYAFKLLQYEIELSAKYEAIEADNGSYVVQHHTKVDGGRIEYYVDMQFEC
ncbi:protein FAR1-RELATED SEQUENCE 11-like [Medicago truncatula]|uniref:protein FAR1-RELATED SEQUENCE 11-like n=1 Tax=Medicago truncatula TaxID=3880 RepID=UPI000D2F21DE|nr:protein FAR1-RELATED SEQUENCE 11-like [Medicago truncatula]